MRLTASLFPIAGVILVLLAAAGESVRAEDPVAGLTRYLADHSPVAKEIARQSFAGVPLSRTQAEQAKQLLWQAHQERIRRERSEEMNARQVPAGGTSMRFVYRIFGEKPAGGRSLYISLHGGGGAPPRVNDSQWRNQQQLYQPEEGVYVAPRAPANTWNLWHVADVDKGLDRIIENLVVWEDVNPDRVFLLGYSAGGDGVYQLAPRMADRFAAASMMAGHPNEASPRGLRNLPFSIHVGENDAAYNRNKVAEEWRSRLKKLREQDPGGYKHWVPRYEDKGHWLDREDRAALPWMAKFTREPLPRKIVWQQDDVAHTRFYWLALDEEQAVARRELIAEREGQQIALRGDTIQRVTVRLNDAMLDLDQPLRITFNGQIVYEGTPQRRIAVLAKTLEERGDPASVFSAEVVVMAPDKPAPSGS